MQQASTPNRARLPQPSSALPDSVPAERKALPVAPTPPPKTAISNERPASAIAAKEKPAEKPADLMTQQEPAVAVPVTSLAINEPMEQSKNGTESGQSVQDSATDNGLADGKLLHWYQLPGDIRQQAEALKINVIQQASQPEDSWALINMQRFRQGDRLPGDFYLLEIRAQALLLQQGDYRFELTVGD